MKALKFVTVIRERNRIQLPMGHIKTLERELGIPSMVNYILVLEIKSIKSPLGVEFLESNH